MSRNLYLKKPLYKSNFIYKDNLIKITSNKRYRNIFLTKKELRAFKKLYLDLYGVELSNLEAAKLGTKLVNFVDVQLED